MPVQNNSVVDNEKYLESIISTYKSLDQVIFKEIEKGTSEDIIKVLDRQIDTIFNCIVDFKPATERERAILLQFSIDMIEGRMENSQLASRCLSVIRRNIDPIDRMN
ncbi:MAG: hypothetical protein AB3N20_12590 [Rhizobiaceae bacterium]